LGKAFLKVLFWLKPFLKVLFWVKPFLKVLFWVKPFLKGFVMLSIFNNDIKITMDDETRVRKDRKIYKSPTLLNEFPLTGNVKLYEKYKKEIASIDYDLTYILKKDCKTNNWYQLNQQTDNYVIQIRGYLTDANADSNTDANADANSKANANKFNITKVAIQELLNNNDLLLNI